MPKTKKLKALGGGGGAPPSSLSLLTWKLRWSPRGLILLGLCTGSPWIR